MTPSKENSSNTESGADSEGFAEQWRTRRRALRHLTAIFQIIWQGNKAFVSMGLLIRIAAALLPLGLLAVSRVIIDDVSLVASGKPLNPGFWSWVVVEVVLACLGAILGRSNWYVDTVLGERMSHNLSLRVMEHAASLDLSSYEDPVFYDKLEQARHQATDRTPLVSALGMLIQQAITTAALGLGIVVFSPWILGILLVSLVPSIIGESHFAFLGYSLASRQAPVRRHLDYLRFLGASKDSAKELKLFSLAGFLNGEFRRFSEEVFGENRRFWKRRFAFGAILSLVALSGYYSAYVFAVWRAVNREMSVGTLTFLIGSISGATIGLQAIFSTFSNIADQSLFLTSLVNFLETRPALSVSAKPRPVPRPIREGFRFENVGFHYPGRETPVLVNFNFHLSPGERVALVGENGQGKTTIIKLLTRLYDPTSGRILLDGVDLREYDPQSLFSEFSVIFQDFMRYDMIAKKNIAVGQIDMIDHDSDLRIADAAERSGASAVIERLPLKMDQMLGTRFQDGVDLSGGEWQKIALARAYLRKAQVYILDEPTAALDAKSELEVFERFGELTRDHMALLISHRFSTVKMADRIIVLRDGQIAEQGHHDQLIALGGLYASLFDLQAASYR